MLTLPPSVRVYVATAPCDMRKQFDGLAAMVREGLREDPRSGHLFVAFNRRADQVRILFWDRSGYCLVSKRLERGRFGRGLRMELEAAPRPHVDARWRQEGPRIVARSTKNSASQRTPLRDASTPLPGRPGCHSPPCGCPFIARPQPSSCRRLSR